jgi:hypothetical protein
MCYARVPMARTGGGGAGGAGEAGETVKQVRQDEEEKEKRCLQISATAACVNGDTAVGGATGRDDARPRRRVVARVLLRRSVPAKGARSSLPVRRSNRSGARAREPDERTSVAAPAQE